MSEFAIGLLISLSSFLGVEKTPILLEQWKIEKKWTKENEISQFVAKNEEITEKCKKNTNLQLEFPMIIHGVHKLYGDNSLILSTGNADFSKATSFYFSPTVSCEILSKYSQITWVAYGYSDYFSRFNFFPRLRQKNTLSTFKSISMSILAAGALIMLAIFSAVIFFNKVSRSLALNIIGSCVFFSIYLIFTSIDYFNLNFTMLTAHKIADFALWFGSFFFVNGLYEKKVIGKLSFQIYLASASFACLLIAIGNNGDIVQLGTTIPFPVVMLLLIHALFGEWSKFKKDKKSANLLHFISVLTFTIAAHYDIMVVTGMADGIPIFSVGVLFAIFTLTLAVNDEITQTYKQRDGLLLNLEEKVAEKTLGLRQALIEKEKAQAELIHSAKLVSLGTLSAGIAHEINNSINYVNGAIVPLEKIMSSAVLEEKQRILMNKLFKSIKDGSKMTVDIVRSLRNYTGINQAKYADLNLREASLNVLTILRNKISDKITIQNNINPDINIFGNKVGINQIFMNLISNAIDAMPTGGIITLNVVEKDTEVILTVADNGPGIPEKIVTQIFDPFFTTKDVGHGTGLGLHIVKKEIENHKGSIEFTSSPEHGTCFTLKIPKSTLAINQLEVA